MDKDFLVECDGCKTMPGCGSEGAFKIAIESFNIPAHVIELSQF